MEHHDPLKQAALIEIRDQAKGTESSAQCDRLLTALHRFPVTTFEAMRFLDVYHVPARVLQLRKRGHEIDTHWLTVQTESGDKHRVGLYALKRGVTMQPTKNDAPDLSVHGAQECQHANSEPAAARDQHDKAIQTLQARAALAGFTLHLIDTGATGPTFMVSRWNLSRTLPDVASVESFLAQAGVTSA